MTWIPSTGNTFEYVNESATYREGAFGEESTYVIVRKIKRMNNGLIVVPNDFNLMVLEAALPKQSEPALPTSIGVTGRNFDALTCTGWSITIDPTRRSCTATITYSSNCYVDQYGTVARPDWPVSTSYQSVTRLAKVYRRSWTTNPPTGSDASANIGGTAVGDSGATITMNVPQVRMRVTFTQSADASGADMVTRTTGFLAYVGKLNSAAFAGFGIGTVLCEGFNIVQTKMPEYQMVVDLLWDEWAHHEQVPTNGADGRPNWSGSNLAEVRWVRPTRSTIDFNNIFYDTQQRDIALKGTV
jgi:hypothetical protein